jgi:hypothetical protein
LTKADDNLAVFSKIDFSQISQEIWSTKISSLSATNPNQFGVALLSSDESTIFNVLAFDDTILFIMINESDGLPVSSSKYPNYKYKLSATGSSDVLMSIIEANNILYCMFNLNGVKFMAYYLRTHRLEVYRNTNLNINYKGIINNGIHMIIYGYLDPGSIYQAYYLTLPIYEVGSSYDIINDGSITLDPISSSNYDVSSMSFGALSASSHSLSFQTNTFLDVTTGSIIPFSATSGESWHSNDEFWDTLYTNTNYDKTVYFT